MSCDMMSLHNIHDRQVRGNDRSFLYTVRSFSLLANKMYDRCESAYDSKATRDDYYINIRVA